ncbi:hypothetical protein BT96DRAFT_1005989 [Gymnopus androsaceus JB14]|uniref:Uncharacterized protein n=1 Tax=Gymnopus androsaceus JB14 TaxID=1447944 RepID=A0A6A4GLU8_9AGAR|nr:hypothetical protein BT96DRAFT_1005989 [Gymnopus androsaceus JB14]
MRFVTPTLMCCIPIIDLLQSLMTPTPPSFVKSHISKTLWVFPIVYPFLMVMPQIYWLFNVFLGNYHKLANELIPNILPFVVLLALPPSPTNSAPLMPASSIAGPSKPSSSDPPSGLSFPSLSRSSKSLASLSSPFDENGELQEDCEWFDLSHP